jgi:hypothetical protein
MMKIINYLAVTTIVLILLASCRKIAHLSPVPHIAYTSFRIFDTTDILGNVAKGGRLKFTFEDGDGDLGLNAPSDSLSDTTNLFFRLYRKIGGIMVLAPPNDPIAPSAYRIPFMDRQGQDKTLKGTISVTFLYLFYSPADTIKYDFWVKDRALNVSDTATTSEIVLTVDKTYK